MSYFHNITKCDMNNGDGLRVVLWLSGCSHHCPECQNPQTWNPENGVPFDEGARAELMDALMPDYIQGLTFSGGDPMYEGNREVVLDLCKMMKNIYPNKDIWMWTGYTYEEILQNELMSEILSYVDVLVDGRYKKELRDISIPWRGSTNQRVINVKKSTLDNIIKHCE